MLKAKEHVAVDELSVVELISDRKWNLQGICNDIEPLMLRLINDIPLADTRKRDKLIWAAAKYGQYNVKLGYRCANSILHMNNSIGLDDRIWKSLWNLKVMPKIKHFIWRILNRALASREAPFNKKCSPDFVCQICGEEVETLEHISLLCR